MGKFTIIIFILLICTNLYSQTKQPGITKTEIISTPVDNPVITEIVRNLNIARTNNDMQSKLYWEKKLQKAANLNEIEVKPDTTFISKREIQNTNAITDVLNVSMIQDRNSSANAVSIDRFNGNIYVAAAIIGGQTGDTITIYRSTNNGFNFFPIYSFKLFSGEITRNGLDIEVISKGDSSYIFLALNYTKSGIFKSALLRVRQDGRQVVFYPKGLENTIQYKGARITSDNANFTDATYVYFLYEKDSIVNGQTFIKSNLEIITDAFKSFPFEISTGYVGNNGQYGYNISGPAPSGAEFETDIAYVHTVSGANQLYTITVVRGVPGSFGDGTGLFFTRSNTFGATQPTLFSTTDVLRLKKNPRIASTGFRDNSLTVVTNRLYLNGDWDPFNFHSEDISAAAPIFNNTFLSSSTDTTISVSVAARYRSNGTYIFGYSDYKQPGTNVFIKSLKNGTYSPSIQVNNIQSSPNFGHPDVSFRNVNNDSCFVVWGGFGGVGTYATGGCSGPFIGISNQNTEIDDYLLNQNYPNPFNPTTNISFSTQTSAFVKISVYDVLGNEIAEILNEKKNSGYYNYIFDGKNLPSGVYYYKIELTTSELKSFSQTRKMILLK
ncbi:MAG: T9SS type A sorting domain-containing protein [Ignavibacteria bacterium]|nr:T9SS type A sorting domain-containing protein [Ignavibacteria bacterium]